MISSLNLNSIFKWFQRILDDHFGEDIQNGSHHLELTELFHKFINGEITETNLDYFLPLYVYGAFKKLRPSDRGLILTAVLALQQEIGEDAPKQKAIRFMELLRDTYALTQIQFSQEEQDDVYVD